MFRIGGNVLKFPDKNDLLHKLHVNVNGGG